MAGPANTIIVVDDQPDVGQLVVEAAQAVGYQATFLSDPARLEELLAQGEPTVLALDLRMPGYDGIEILGALGTRGLKSKVLLVSGMDQRTLQAAERIATGHGLRILGVVSKPFNMAAMRELLAKGLAPPPDVTEAELEIAIAEGQFFLEYQPKVNLRSGKVAGAEALARWQRPDQGVVPPMAFIPKIEASYLMKPFTVGILRAAAGQRRAWAEAGHDVKVAVNVSAGMVADPTMPDKFAATTAEAKVSPEKVVLEITETGVMADAKRSIEVLTRVRVKGFDLSMDDFGIGYSSMQQLHRMPFNELKIDRSFVAEMGTAREAAAIVRSIVDLGHNMGLVVCAEGVEDRDTHQALVSLGCDLAQGFYYGRPMKAQIPPSAWLHEEP
jgi:EAL domain-containing protein (putative c-di-GMP-specific phosphodiesterase class I)/ActR/RegA family two-component response regulator